MAVGGDVVSAFGLAAAFYLFVSPAPTTMKTIVGAKSSQLFSPAPYLAQLLESGIWVIYGSLLSGSRYMILACHATALLFQAVYISIFLLYKPDPGAMLSRRGTLVWLVFILGVVCGIVALGHSAGPPGAPFTCGPNDQDEICAIVGDIAAAINCLKFYSPLAVARQVVRTKSVEFMPLHLTIAMTLCTLLWGAYGFIENDEPMKICNSAGAVSCAVQILIYCKYYRSKVESLPDERSLAMISGPDRVSDFNHDRERHGETGRGTSDNAAGAPSLNKSANLGSVLSCALTCTPALDHRKRQSGTQNQTIAILEISQV